MELEIFYNEDWMEVLGCGVPWVLQKLLNNRALFYPANYGSFLYSLTLEKTVGVVGEVSIVFSSRRSGINGA